MPVSVIIAGFSLLLFLYWFRYTCLLILRAKGTRDFTARVSQTNGLELMRVRAALKLTPPMEELAALHAALERDYGVLTGILRHASSFQVRSYRLEQWMLMADFRVLSAWFRLVRRLPGAIGQAQEAIEEMTDIVAHFANAMGERSAMRPARMLPSI